MFRIGIYIGILVLFFSCSNQEERIQPEVTSIVESVYSSVIIQPDSLYKVHASINGILDQNFIEEGDIVNKGNLLIKIKNIQPKLQADNAKLTLELANKNMNGRAGLLQSVKEEIKAVQLTLTNDSINYHRQKNLWEQRIGSKTEFDTKELKYQLSKNALTLLHDKYEQTQNELQTNLKQAENNYTSSMVNTEDFSIKSNINGKVYALYKNPGEMVSIQEPIALLGSPTRFIIEMLVDEEDIIKIKIEQEVILSLDAYQNQVFRAKVHKVYPNKDERNQSFKVEALFQSLPETLYPGLAGEANIIISRRENALTIPKQYLTDENKVKTNEDYTSIELGIESLDRVEVLSGLSPSTWIYKPE